jgi:hypothetical protein
MSKLPTQALRDTHRLNSFLKNSNFICAVERFHTFFTDHFAEITDKLNSLGPEG